MKTLRPLADGDRRTCRWLARCQRPAIAARWDEHEASYISACEHHLIEPRRREGFCSVCRELHATTTYGKVWGHRHTDGYGTRTRCPGSGQPPTTVHSCEER